ncbi:MAG: ATP synthase F1 subunit delta [Pirellulales bacterium]
MSNNSQSTGSHGDAADSRSRQVATVYAKAFLGAAGEKAQDLLEELGSLVTDVLNGFPAWETVLSSALVSPDEKVAMLDRTVGPQASATLLNFLKVLARHGRLDCIRPIYRLAQSLHNESQGKIPVEVRTAEPLDDQLAQRIAQAVRGLTGREPQLLPETDPSLIAGVVLRIGDTVYDASVSSQLERTRVQMINRSVHEIQSRRDRFRHSGGN